VGRKPANAPLSRQTNIVVGHFLAKAARLRTETP